MVHHRGCRGKPATAGARLRRPLRQPILWARDDAAGVRRAQAPAFSLVFWRHPDPTQALAVAAALGATRSATVGCPRPDGGTTLSLFAFRRAMVQRRADPGIHRAAGGDRRAVDRGPP